MMKYPIFGIVAVILLSGISEAQDKPERDMEGGVEVIVNHLKSYAIKDQPVELHLEKLFSINTADASMLPIGLIEMYTFDVDSKGDIFAIRWRASENYVFKFDSQGKFVKSFVRRGQGPGEIEWGGTVVVDNQDRVIAKDPSKSKFLLYDNDGRFLKEIYLPRNLDIEAPLPNGGYLISWQDTGPDLATDHVGLCDSNFRNIQSLGAHSFSNLMGTVKPKVGEDKLIQTASKGKIYVGYSKNGYEIGVYDLEGNMLRKIRKKYSRVRIDQDDKDKFLKLNQRNPDRDKYYFADYWPAFRYCFADDDDRLFVMTYEKGERPREAVYDVFNSEGVLITRTTLDNVGQYMLLTVRARKDRIYCLREDDEGYKELVVYKANWK
jgi:hypothetical protein